MPSGTTMRKEAAAECCRRRRRRKGLVMSDERDIQQVIAKYVRAVDRRDGVALAELFIPNGKVTIFYTNGGKEELIVELAGREVIGNAMSNLMKAHPARGWSHHTTFDTIIEVDGERATVDAQFIVWKEQRRLVEDRRAPHRPRYAVRNSGEVTMRAMTYDHDG